MGSCIDRRVNQVCLSSVRRKSTGTNAVVSLLSFVFPSIHPHHFLLLLFSEGGGMGSSGGGGGRKGGGRGNGDEAGEMDCN